ncbi:MAG TPA: hypothetical protein VMV10_12610 [Pirellulales bacterium]|nr:hypothetical protein [Pirellulales bacterium]
MNDNPYKSPEAPSGAAEPRPTPRRPGCAALLLAVAAFAVPLRVAWLNSAWHSWHSADSQAVFVISIFFAAGCSIMAAGMLRARAPLVNAGAFLLILSFAAMVALFIKFSFG